MTLIKTSILSFIATVVKMFAALVVSKAVAIYIGPTGLALVGQFQNFTQLAMTAAQGAINAGVTKYAAEYGGQSGRIPVLFSTAIKISLFSSVIVGGCIVFFSQTASVHFLKTDEYSYVFIIFGFTIVLFVINSLLLAILNGLKDIKTWVNISIIQSIYGLVFTTLLIVLFGLDGALIALVTNQSVVLLIVLWMLRKHDVIKLCNFSHIFDKAEARKLAAFSIMAITSATVVPLSHLILRNYVGDNLGWDKAGYWQAIWYISKMYLMVVTTSLSIYYLPRLSEIQDKAALRHELLNGYKVIMPIVIFISLLVYMLRDVIIWILFTEEFTPMANLFAWQLVGDVLKMASWLLSYLMLAKAKTREFIATEIVFSASFVGFSIWLVELFGLIGITYAFALNYLLYLITVFFLVRSELFESKEAMMS